MNNLNFLNDFWDSPSAYSEVDNGWVPLIAKLHIDLIKIDPKYRISQVKEKFGGLRFYAYCNNTANADEFNARIKYAEDASFLICETCGLPGKTYDEAWRKCMCERCRSEIWNTRLDAEKYNKNNAKIQAETNERNLKILTDFGLEPVRVQE